MNIYKIISNCFIVTIVAVLYVHLHVETIKMGYSVQENNKHLSYLVDQNSKLMYNLSRLESPKSLLSAMNEDDIRFTSNKTENGEIRFYCQMEPEISEEKSSIMSRFLDLFSTSAEAKPRSKS